MSKSLEFRILAISTNSLALLLGTALTVMSWIYFSNINPAACSNCVKHKMLLKDCHTNCDITKMDIIEIFFSYSTTIVFTIGVLAVYSINANTLLLFLSLFGIYSTAKSMIIFHKLITNTQLKFGDILPPKISNATTWIKWIAFIIEIIAFVTSWITYKNITARKKQPEDQLVELNKNNNISARRHRQPIIFIIGGPGSGKKTLSKKLAQKYSFSSFSVGELLAEAAESGTEEGLELNRSISRGEIITMNTVVKHLKDIMMCRSKSVKGFIIYNFPNNIDEAIAFETNFFQASFVIYLKCDDVELVNRLIEREKVDKRLDDRPAIIYKRLEMFHFHAVPVISYFKNRLFIVHAKQPLNQVFTELVKIIEENCQLD